MHTEMEPITFDFYPDVFKSYFIIGLVSTLMVSIILTLTLADIDYNDNIVYNTFGLNSLCLMLDYPPVIYVAPACYSVCMAMICPYIFGSWIRIYSHYANGEVSKCAFNTVTLISILEFFAFAFHSTVFAVNDESIQLHVMAYVQLIFALMLGCVRNLWYLENFGHFKSFGQNCARAYTVLFLFFGTVYGSSMSSVVLIGKDLIPTQFLRVMFDRGFTALYIGMAFIGYGIQSGTRKLKITVELDDAPGATENTPLKEVM